MTAMARQVAADRGLRSRVRGVPTRSQDATQHGHVIPSAWLPTRAIVAAALAVFMVACAEPPKRVNPVGLSFAAYEDTARRSWTGPQDRPLATAVWYPAALGSRESERRVGIFNAGWNAQKAPLSAATTKRALIVLSHGTGGGAAGMA